MNKPSRSHPSDLTLESLESRTLLAADLAADSASVTPTDHPLNPGDVIRVTARFSNEGDVAAPPFRIQVRLSSNDTFGDSDDIVLGSVKRLLPLGADTSAARSRLFELPDDLAAGDYRVAFLLDSRDVVDESDESNNALVDDQAILNVGGEGESDIEVSGNGAVIDDGDAFPRTADGTSFGPASVDSAGIDRTFTITNRGNSALDIDDVEIVGRNAGDFELISSPDDSIDPGESASFVVRFDPESSGIKRAQVRITSNDPDEGEYSFAISGRGLSDNPEIGIVGLLPIADGDSNASVLDGTHFGVATVGDTIDRTFTIVNTGSGDLNLSAPFVTITGHNTDRFTVVGMPDSTTLAPGESTTFTIRFSATTPGTKKAIVHVFSNDSNESMYDFEIRGRGHP